MQRPCVRPYISHKVGRIAVLAAAFAGVTGAFAEEAWGYFAIRLHGGYGTLAMSEVNTTLEGINDSMFAHGLSSFAEISDGVLIGADVVVSVNQRVTFIISWERHASRVSDLRGQWQFSRFDGRFISAGVMVFPSLEIPVYVIAKTGYGFADTGDCLKLPEYFFFICHINT